MYRYDEDYLLSPTPKIGKQPRSSKDGNVEYTFELSAATREGALPETPVQRADTFRVQDLPRELRCMIWEWVVLHDNVINLDHHPELQKFGPAKPSTAVRRYVPGYYRPTALLTRAEELFRRDYHQTYILDRIPPLFLVSKETYVEAKEVAFRHVMVEIDKQVTRMILNRFLRNMNNQMLKNMRNLYICAPAKVPRQPSLQAPMPIGGTWPVVEFNHRSVPLFHVSVTTDGSTLTLSSQRELVTSDKAKLDVQLTNWSSSLPPNHRFSSKDLINVANLVQAAQTTILFDTWTVRLDDEDKLAHQKKMNAQDELEKRTGYREWADAWMKLESDFRVVLMKITAPCLDERSKDEKVEGGLFGFLRSPRNLLGM